MTLWWIRISSPKITVNAPSAARLFPSRAIVTPSPERSAVSMKVEWPTSMAPLRSTTMPAMLKPSMWRSSSLIRLARRK